MFLGACVWLAIYFPPTTWVEPIRGSDEIAVEFGEDIAIAL